MLIPFPKLIVGGLNASPELHRLHTEHEGLTPPISLDVQLSCNKIATIVYNWHRWASASTNWKEIIDWLQILDDNTSDMPAAILTPSGWVWPLHQPSGLPTTRQARRHSRGPSLQLDIMAAFHAPNITASTRSPFENPRQAPRPPINNAVGPSASGLVSRWLPDTPTSPEFPTAFDADDEGTLNPSPATAVTPPVAHNDNVKDEKEQFLDQLQARFAVQLAAALQPIHDRIFEIQEMQAHADTMQRLSAASGSNIAASPVVVAPTNASVNQGATAGNDMHIMNGQVVINGSLTVNSPVTANGDLIINPRPETDSDVSLTRRDSRASTPSSYSDDDDEGTLVDAESEDGLEWDWVWEFVWASEFESESDADEAAAALDPSDGELARAIGMSEEEAAPFLEWYRQREREEFDASIVDLKALNRARQDQNEELLFVPVFGRDPEPTWPPIKYMVDIHEMSDEDAAAWYTYYTGVQPRCGRMSQNVAVACAIGCF